MISSDHFQTSRVFRDLAPASLDALARHARIIAFRRDERISPLINPPRRLLLILSGVAKLTAATIDGHERIIYVFRPGDLLGSRVFIEHSPEAVYEIIAMSSVTAVSIDLADLHAVGRERADVLIAVTRGFASRLERLTDRLMAAMSEEVSVRLCRLLLDFVAEDDHGSADFVHLEHPLTHETMAHIVGASRPHTSSVLADLERKGVVKRNRRDLLVRPEMLAEIVKQETSRLVPPGPRPAPA
ncbi:MAG: Crp/Fnr family transcriptional regulator [Gemmatimonadota bacterium]